jgi:hypothetical protein
MEKERFYSYLDSSSSANPEASVFFSSLIQKYSYFDSARVIYLRGLKQGNANSFKEQLFKNAGLLPDRRQLFFVLNPVTRAVSAETISVEVKQTSAEKETDQSFVLIEDTQNTSGVLVDISDTPKRTDIPISGYDLLEISDQENGLAKGLEVDSDLIEKFLKSNPRIKPPQPNKEEQEDISLKSVEQAEELLTEPMAKIYLSQGLTDKAISIYEKLSLKYPEKSSYFAGQIQEIKQQLNK